MSILEIIDLVIEQDVIEPTQTIERRDSLKDSPYSDGSIVRLDTILALHDRIATRGTVCRNDATALSDLSTEHSSLAAHFRRYSTSMYSTELSNTLYRETVASLESSVTSSVTAVISNIGSFISEHADSALSYIREVFDADAVTNTASLRVAAQIDYIDSIVTILEKSGISRKVARDIKAVDTVIFDQYTVKWNGLKNLLATGKGDIQALNEAISIPVIEMYPVLLEFARSLLLALESAKTVEDVQKTVGTMTVPVVSVPRLTQWVQKNVGKNNTEKAEGFVTEFQTLAMSVRSHLKALENNRGSATGLKVSSIRRDMQSMEWMTADAISGDLLAKSKALTSMHGGAIADLGRLSKSLKVSDNFGQVVLSKVLETLSVTRGFGALIDSLGMLASVRRELMNAQLGAVNAVSKTLMGLIKQHRNDLTIGEIDQINKATQALKSALQ